jgi:hypothetical protein
MKKAVKRLYVIRTVFCHKWGDTARRAKDMGWIKSSNKLLEIGILENIALSHGPYGLDHNWLCFGD